MNTSEECRSPSTREGVDRATLAVVDALGVL